MEGKVKIHFNMADLKKNNCDVCGGLFKLYDRDMICKTCAFVEKMSDNEGVIEELEKIYKAGSKAVEKAPELRKALKEFAKLEQGNTENFNIWAMAIYFSLCEMKKQIKLLDLRPFESHIGESGYDFTAFMNEEKNSIKTFVGCLMRKTH